MRLKALDGVHSDFALLGKACEQYCGAAKLITGLGAGNHSITIRPKNTSAWTTLDYLGVPSVDSPPVLVSQIPYIKDWAAGGYVTTQAVVDQANAVIGGVVDESKLAGFPVQLVKINEFYDTLTGCGPDNIHPNDRGVGQIALSFLDNISLN